MQFRQNPAFIPDLHRRIENGVSNAAELYAAEVREAHASASRGGSRRNRRGQFRSAAGEAPAIDSGDLLLAMVCRRASYNVYVFDLDDPEVKRYAALLENGTRRMAARKLYRPVLLQQAPNMLQAFVTGFRL